MVRQLIEFDGYAYTLTSKEVALYAKRFNGVDVAAVIATTDFSRIAVKTANKARKEIERVLSSAPR